MSPSAKAFLFDILSTPSPTGFEMNAQRKWAAHVAPFADSVECDAYGNTWATLKSTKADAPTLMLEAHADEIGFMVKFIAENGFVYLDRIGGSDSAVARGRKIHILADKGEVTGIIGNTAVHLRGRSADEKVPQTHDLFVDVGASSARAVEKLGIRVGHPAVYADSAEELAGRRICGRALDNRVGGYILAAVMEKLSKAKSRPAANIVALNAIHEEIGGAGSRMVSHRLRPDAAIVLDVTHATDSPGINKAQHGDVKLGGGPSVTHGTANHPLLVRRLRELAEKKKIPLQHEGFSHTTGTDTDRIYQTADGIPAALVSLPLRYMHTVVELIDLRDVDWTVELLAAAAKSMKDKREFWNTL